MIRSILIFVYIAVVLLVSGLAQAAGYAQINEAKFDQGSYLLHLQGAFLNSCQHAPRPEVVDTIASDGTEMVVIGVRVETTDGIVCTQQLNGRYDLVFDIRALRLKANRDLVVKFKNFGRAAIAPMTVRIEHENLGLQFASMRAAGLLLEVPKQGFAGDANYALVVEDGTTIFVQSLLDLGAYVNRQVRLAGIPLSHHVATELGAIDLSFYEKTGEQPEKVLATEVSLTPLLKVRLADEAKL